MSFIVGPSGWEKMKHPEYRGPDFSKAMTVGVELVEGEIYVSYLRPPVTDLIHQLVEPTPGADAHVYQPLLPGCVRLLRRVERSMSVAAHHHRVAFDFVICSLDDASAPIPQYSAISYCWGNLPTDSHLVLGNGSYLPITAKVARILARIAVDTHHIWLDAVCINQADVAEKALQIPLMASIYRSASSVEVWLGKGEGIPRVLSPSAQNSSTSPNAQFHIDYTPDRHDQFTPYSPENVIDLIWSPWFERAWVVQEFCFGRKHRFHFGDVELHPLFFNMILKDLKSSRFSDDEEGQCQMPLPPMIRNFDRIRRLRSFLVSGPDDKEEQKDDLPRSTCRLEDILCEFYSLKATDPRDKVFAMLNFVNREARDDIIPDYTRHAADVYHDAMESVLFRGTTFRLLGFAGLAAPRPLFDDRPNTSSWVPDLSTPPGHTVWSAERRPSFKATAPLPTDHLIRLKCYHMFDSRSVVTIQNTPKLSNNYEHQSAFIVPLGKHITTVTDVLPGNPSQNMTHLPEFLFSAMARTPSASDVLRKTLIAENPDCLRADPAGKGFDQLCDLVLPEGRDLNASPPIPGKLPSSALWNEDAPEARSYFQTMLQEGTGSTRGLFWTKSASPTSDDSKDTSSNQVSEENDDNLESPGIGLAANGVQPGDEVWLFVGAGVPFILRPCHAGEVMEDSSSKEEASGSGSGENKNNLPPAYFMICEAYVYGIMHAEVDIISHRTAVMLV